MDGDIRQCQVVPAVDGAFGRLSARPAGGEHGGRVRGCQNRVRGVVLHRYTSLFVNVLIFANLVTLTVQANTTDSIPSLDTLDIVFNTIFTIELVAKMFGLGVFRPKAFFSEAWNKLDFFIVVTSWLPMLPGLADGVSAAKALRAFRALRALRAFRALKFMKNVNMILSAVGSSLPMMASTVMLALFIIVIYGVAGVQFFKGIQVRRVQHSTTKLVFGGLRTETIVVDAG